MPEYLRAQVELITSIPKDAFARVHKLTMEAVTSGEDRTREIMVELNRTMEVTLNRATLIANTETARTASVLVQKQSEVFGFTHYMWQTKRDHRVRDPHKNMQGLICKWSAPPFVDDGFGYNHPGRVPNCRCWPIPVTPGRR